MEPTVNTVQNLVQSSQSVLILGMALLTLVLLLTGLLWHHARKIRRLEQKLVSQHRFFRQEMKMMNQGAIGVGHRVKHLEKQVRQQPVTPTAAKPQAAPGTFEQLLKGYNEAPAPSPIPASKPRKETAAIRSTAEPSKPMQSRAEQALADWMKDYQTTA